MIPRIGLILLAILPLVAQAGEIPAKPFGRGIILLPQYPPGKRPKVQPSPLIVVRDAKAYARFLSRIPREQISRTRPAPPNTDPLLKKPRVDFAKHTLLVVTRESMTRPVFKNITATRMETLALVDFPREVIAARPTHIGTYTAVLIPRTDKSVRLKSIEAKR